MTGRLTCLTGPSDSGKDSLLWVTCEPLALRGCRIVRRVITCSVEAVRGGAQVVTPAQFNTLERASAFTMSWYANNLRYSISVQIDEWLTQGYDILVNDSCGYLTQAHRHCPDLLAVLFGIKPEVLRQRLLVRGRESPEEIEACLARNAEFVVGLEGSLSQPDNSGNLDDTLRSLPARLGGSRACV